MRTFQTITQLHSSHKLTRLCWKSFKLGFNSTWTENFQMYKLNLEKAEGSEIKLQISFLFSSVARSVVSHSLWPQGLQHTRPPSLSPIPGVYSNPGPLTPSCHPTISSSVIPFSSCLQSFPASGSFLMSQFFRCPEYWSFSFSISPFNEYSGLISFIDSWISLQCKGLYRESSPTPQFKSTNSSSLSFLYSPTLTSIHDYWKNHSFD